MKQLLSFALALTLSLALMYFSLRGMNIQSILQSLLEIHKGQALLAALFIALSSLLKAFFIQRGSPLSTLGVTKAIFLGHFGNSILPFRMGELAEFFTLKTQGGLRKTQTFGLLTFEKLFDLLCLSLLSLTLALSVELEGVKTTYLVTFFTATCSTIVLLTIPAFRMWVFRFIKYVGNKNSKLESFAKKIIAILESFSLGFAAIKSPIDFGITTFFCLLSHLSICLGYLLLLQACGIELSPLIGILLFVGLNFSLIVPTLPAGIGVYQAVCIFILGKYGISKELALTYSFSLQAVEVLTFCTAGLISLSKVNYQGLFNYLKRSSLKEEPI
jgi:uncharacterized protein (TIRG00374 family)